MASFFFVSDYSTFVVAAAALCALVAAIRVLQKVNSQTNLHSARPSEEGNNGDAEEVPDRAITVGTGLERQVIGESMIEQLVPDILCHVISCLDYKSLCCLSMTNSLMKVAADDEDAWRTRYFKDFASDEANITPPNGWKAYYATTRAVCSVNALYFRIIRDRQLPAMRQLWLSAEFVKCFHDGSISYIGYEAIMESWRLLFSWDNEAQYDVRNVRARILGNIAWVTMKTYVDIEVPPFNVTNVFEFHDGRWYMVLHQCSPSLIDDA